MPGDDDEGDRRAGDAALDAHSLAGVTAADTPRTRGVGNSVALPTRFTVKGTLGEGGMGTVVEAYDRALGRDVAIKLLAQGAHDDALVGARFVREARAAAQLRHPGIVQIHDIDPDGQYIVMELVRGESLATKLARERKLAPAEVRRIGAALLDALGVAHAASIVHRDVKPANVLLGESGEVKLADFGVAFFGDSELTSPGARIGTPAYMAPEQLRARTVDARADVYSAGATLFEAATGKRHHDDDVHADPATAVREATGDATLAQAIARAIRDRPAERFATAAEMARALEGETVIEPGRGSRRARWLVAGAAVALVAAGGVYALRGGGGAGDRGAAASGEGAAIVPAPADASTAPIAIAMLPFTDTTKNPLLDFAASGLPNLLGIELHGVPGVQVIGYYRLLGHVAGPDAALPAWRAAAARLGATVFVRGELSPSGDAIHVVIRIEDAAGAVLGVVERDAKVEAVPEVIRTAAATVAQTSLGRRVEPSGAPPRTTPSFAAERELQLGIAALEQQAINDAITHLRAAVHHAPDLAVAHYYLAATLSWTTPPVAPALEEIDKALALGLDDAQRGFLAGIRHLVLQDFAAGSALLRPLAEQHPTNKDILYALFETLFHGGQPAEAMAVYRRLIAIAPRFRLALVHAFTFYVGHGDDAGMNWALSLGGDPSAPGTDAHSWEPRILVARREYGAAIEVLSAPEAADLQGELVATYVLDGKLELAAAVLGKQGASNPGPTAPAQLGLAAARGDAVGRTRWRSLALRHIATLPAGPQRTLELAWLAAAEVGVATEDELAQVRTRLEDSIVPDHDRSLNLNVARALLAEALGDTAALGRLAASPYPEVSETAVAATARRAGDRKTAAAAIRRAIAASGDARFLIQMWASLAGDQRALGDHAGVIAACDEVIRPRLFMWQWGARVGDCLAWTAEAHEALGKPADARAAWARLLAIRTGAPAGDRLVTAARAALARLR